MKILIVEDEEKVGRFVERALTEQAYTVRRVATAAAARDAGRLRVEGKDYVIEDGDVVHFRFNV